MRSPEQVLVDITIPRPVWRHVCCHRSGSPVLGCVNALLLSNRVTSLSRSPITDFCFLGVGETFNLSNHVSTVRAAEA